MTLKDKFEAVTRAVGGAKLKASEGAPTVMVVAGVASLISAGVIAVSKTHKVEPVIDRLSTKLQLIQDEKDSLEERERVEMKTAAYLEAGSSIIKIYAVPLILAGVGSTSILWSHGLMRRRNAALIAAYGVLERAYSSYRARIVESIDAEFDEHIANGKVVKLQDYDKKKDKVMWSVSDPKEEEGMILGPDGSRSEYAVDFDETNRNWNFSRAENNLFFLRSQEQYANRLLRRNGHLFLNEVYDMIGIKRTRAGAVVGWIYRKDWDAGDGYVDFRLPAPGSPEENDFIYYWNGETPILVDPNVDGVILSGLEDR